MSPRTYSFSSKKSFSKKLKRGIRRVKTNVIFLWHRSKAQKATARYRSQRRRHKNQRQSADTTTTIRSPSKQKPPFRTPLKWKARPLQELKQRSQSRDHVVEAESPPPVPPKHLFRGDGKDHVKVVIVQHPLPWEIPRLPKPRHAETSQSVQKGDSNASSTAGANGRVVERRGPWSWMRIARRRRKGDAAGKFVLTLPTIVAGDTPETSVCAVSDRPIQADGHVRAHPTPEAAPRGVFNTQRVSSGMQYRGLPPSSEPRDAGNINPLLLRNILGESSRAQDQRNNIVKKATKSMENLKQDYSELLEKSQELLRKASELLIAERAKSADLMARLDVTRQRGEEWEQYARALFEKYQKQFPEIAGHLEGFDGEEKVNPVEVSHVGEQAHGQVPASPQSIGSAPSTETITVALDPWPMSYEAFLEDCRDGNFKA